MTSINEIAKDIGLDMAKFKADKDGEDCKKLRRRATRTSCRSSTSTRRRASSSTAPHVGGALPKENFKQMIDEKLKAAEASGVPGAEYYDKEVMAKGEKQFRSKKDPKPAGK